jgi:hypothetical protein
MAADGSGVSPITPDIGGVVQVTPMSWSAAGIAFTTVNLAAATYQVWSVNPDGSNLRLLAGPQANIPAPYWFRQP